MHFNGPEEEEEDEVSDDDDDDDEHEESARLWDWPSIKPSTIFTQLSSSELRQLAFLRPAFVNNYGLKTSIMRS